MHSAFNSDILLRLLTIGLITTRYIYWEVTAQRSNREKPKLRPNTPAAKQKRLALALMGALIYLQLLGLNIAPFYYPWEVQAIGFGIALVGFAVSMSARRTLGTNWAHAAEYQIKTNHELITSGVYRYIRHPIYVGIALTGVGAEIVAGSWLFIPLLGLSLLTASSQARKEEAILIRQFGTRYQEYMRHTKRFVPYLW
jgi:protein-S-isoprenylcysteine O-methyltransferase Ste14